MSDQIETIPVVILMRDQRLIAPVEPDLHHSEMGAPKMGQYLSGRLTAEDTTRLTGSGTVRPFLGVMLQTEDGLMLYDANEAHQDLQNAATILSNPPGSVAATPLHQLDDQQVAAMIDLMLECQSANFEMMCEFIDDALQSAPPTLVQALLPSVA